MHGGLEPTRTPVQPARDATIGILESLATHIKYRFSFVICPCLLYA